MAPDQPRRGGRGQPIVEERSVSHDVAPAGTAVPARAESTAAEQTTTAPAAGGNGASQHNQSTYSFVGTPTGRRVRARLARFNTPWQTTRISEVLEPVIADHNLSHPKADVALLQRAFDVAS